jgi:acetyl/propionyl-CoA carboxylase alpha subunit
VVWTGASPPRMPASSSSTSTLQSRTDKLLASIPGAVIELRCRSGAGVEDGAPTRPLGGSARVLR